jgi:hypothetical protein
MSMKIYCYHTRAYAEILKEFFLSSIEDDYEVVLREGHFQGEIVNYQETLWDEITRDKVAFIVEAIEDNWMRHFVFSDPDVQFFAETKRFLLDFSQGYDLVMQKSDPWGGVCSGYFVCLGNAKTLRFWEDVHALIDTCSDDQAIANDLLRTHPAVSQIAARFPKRMKGRVEKIGSQRRRNPYGLAWRCLPLNMFYLPGAVTGEIWSPGVSIDVPHGIRMHHASWVVGRERKIAQLRYVRDVVRARMMS